jgi:lipid-A-disaccharide synthase
MIVILPFEKAFYARFNYRADFAGHPLLDELEAERSVSRESFLKNNGLSEKPIVAVLPGSRMQEIKKMLPALLEVESKFPDYQFVVAGMTSVPKEAYQLPNKTVKLVFDQTHALLRHAAAALVTSGTATLETALLGTPQVVVYKTSPITYMVGKLLVHIRFFSLVNLIMDDEVVTELLQKDFSADRLALELDKILHDSGTQTRIETAYTSLRNRLGKPGVSDRIAKIIIEEDGLEAASSLER